MAIDVNRPSLLTPLDESGTPSGASPTNSQPVSAAATSTIRATLVPNHLRLRFLPKAFGLGHFMEGELSVYGWMQRLSPDYHGGFWQFYTLDNGGFYLAPSAADCAVRDGRSGFAILCEGNGFEGFVSPDAAGIIATAFALNHMLWDGRHHLESAYHALLDYVYGHPEAQLIRGALD